MNATLRRAALQALNECGNYLLPQKTVAAAMRLTMPTPTLTEIGDELRRMEEACLIVPGRGPLGDVNWKLTAAGAAVCAELGM